ncbi:5-formyltetrahydrofolate cyclo-ligase [Desulfuribacillus stibiiarsenatis]|uniref:5-formyltetrahydrofolate cyclo-ligase n=2 Tax=Desulfuribacillus stibiiarsenatis TaxID=1390249 RepID=A0A1E5L545_9FIRM|nr:5-formyltetrahydrofolate cyclo-ligase [Desulfuribacillus stibiiarsenatis]
MLLQRMKVSKQSRVKKSAVILERLKALEEIQQAKRVMVYVNFQDEVETKDFIQYLWDKNIEVIVPLSDPKSRELHPSLLYSFEELAPGNFGVLEPIKQAIRIVDVDTLDVIIVPGLAFDRHGGRIGYGAGYYDRFFERTPNATIIAVAFDEQIISEVPMENHDKRIPLIITDQEFIETKFVL